MISFKSIDYNNNNNYDFNNIIYSKSISRPSKSLLDVDKYKNYQKIDINNSLLNEFDITINNNTDLILKDALNKIKKYINFTDFNNDYKFDLDLLNILSLNNINLLVLINTKHINSLNYLINEFKKILAEIKIDDILILSYPDLYNYPCVEFLFIILQNFVKIKIYYSKIIKSNIIICIKFKSNDLIKNFCNKVVINNPIINIRNIGIYFDNNFMKYIYIYNNLILDYYIQKNIKIIDLNIINEKQYILENYKKQIGLNNYTTDCIHKNIIYSYFNNCCICKECHELFIFT